MPPTSHTTNAKIKHPGYPTSSHVSDGYAQNISKALSSSYASQKVMMTVALARSKDSQNEKVYLGLSGMGSREGPFLEKLKSIIQDANIHPDGVKRDIVLVAPAQDDVAKNNVRLLRPRDKNTEIAQHELAKAHAQVRSLGSDDAKLEFIQTMLNNRLSERNKARKSIEAKIKTLSEDNDKLLKTNKLLAKNALTQKVKTNKQYINEISVSLDSLFTQQTQHSIYLQRINTALDKLSNEPIIKNLKTLNDLKASIRSYVEKFGISAQPPLIKAGNVIYSEDHILNGLSENDLFIDHSERVCSEVRAIIRSGQEKYEPQAFSTFWVGEGHPHPALNTKRPPGVKFSDPCETCATNQTYLLALGRALIKTDAQIDQLPIERMSLAITPKTRDAANAAIMEQILRNKKPLIKTPESLISRPISLPSPSESETSQTTQSEVYPSDNEGRRSALSVLPESHEVNGHLGLPTGYSLPEEAYKIIKGEGSNGYFLMPIGGSEPPSVPVDQPISIHIPNSDNTQVFPTLLVSPISRDSNNNYTKFINWDAVIREGEDTRPWANSALQEDILKEFFLEEEFNKLSIADKQSALDKLNRLNHEKQLGGSPEALKAAINEKGGDFWGSGAREEVLFSSEPTNFERFPLVEDGVHPVGTGFNAGMVLLGMGGVYSSIRRGDTVSAVIGAGQTATGATGLGLELGLRTGLVKMSTAAESVTKTIPFVGTMFSVYAVGEDGKNIYELAKKGDTLGIVKGSVDLGLDSAIGVCGLVPGVGNAVAIPLVALRMLSDGVIDEFANPYAYKTSFSALKDPNSWWLEKGLSAVSGSVQYVAESYLDFFVPWRTQYFADKQKVVLNKLQEPGKNAKEFFIFSDKNNICVLDFNSPALAHHTGGLNVDFSSKISAKISFAASKVGPSEYTFNQDVNDFNPKKASTLKVIMGEGATYEYASDTTFSIIGKVQMPVESAILRTTSLQSSYKAPQDGTHMVFVAPRGRPRLNDSGLPAVKNLSSLSPEEISYKIQGGTGNNIYHLGYQTTEIVCGSGSNEIDLLSGSNKPQTIRLVNFRDDGRDKLTIDNLHDADFIRNAQIIRAENSSQILLKFGQTTLELPKTLKTLPVKISSDGGNFNFNLEKFMTSGQSSALLKEYATSAIIKLPNSEDGEPFHKIEASDVPEIFTLDFGKNSLIQIQNFNADQDKIKITNFNKHAFSKFLNKEFTLDYLDQSPYTNAPKSVNHFTLSFPKEFNLKLSYSTWKEYQSLFNHKKSLKIDTGAGYFDIKFNPPKNTQITKIKGPPIQSKLDIKSIDFSTMTCTHGKNETLVVKASEIGRRVIKNFDSSEDRLKFSGFTYDTLKKITAKTERGILKLSCENIDVEISSTHMKNLTLQTDHGIFVIDGQRLISVAGEQNLWQYMVSSVRNAPQDSVAPLEGTNGTDLFVFGKGQPPHTTGINYDDDRIKMTLEDFLTSQINFSSTVRNTPHLPIHTEDGIFYLNTQAYINAYKAAPQSQKPFLKDYVVASTMGIGALKSEDTSPITYTATPGSDTFLINSEKAQKTSLKNFDATKDLVKFVKATEEDILKAVVQYHAASSSVTITCGKASVEINLSGKASTLHLTTGDSLFEVDVASLKASGYAGSVELKHYIVSATHGLINHVGEKAFQVEYVGTDGADTFLLNTQQNETLRILDFDFKKDKLLGSNLERTWFEQAGTGITYNATEKTVLLAFGANKVKIEIPLTDEVVENPLIVDSEEGSFALNIPQLITNTKSGSPKSLKDYSVGSLQRSKFFKSPETSEIEVFKGTGGEDEFVLNAQHKGAKILNFDPSNDHIQVLNLEPNWWVNAQALKNSEGLKLKLGPSEVQIVSQDIGEIFVLKANDGVFEINTNTLTNVYKPLPVESAKMGYKNFMVAQGSKTMANDVFTATSGEDTFIINPQHAGKTVIKGFNPGKDKVEFIKPSRGVSQLTYGDISGKSQDVGKDFVITFDSQNELKIENFKKSQFTSAHISGVPQPAIRHLRHHKVEKNSEVQEMTEDGSALSSDDFSASFKDMFTRVIASICDEFNSIVDTIFGKKRLSDQGPSDYREDFYAESSDFIPEDQNPYWI